MPQTHRCHQSRQTQRFTPLSIEQDHIAEFKGGNKAIGAGRNAANEHWHTQCLAGQRFQARAKLADSRHNPAVKQAPSKAEH